MSGSTAPSALADPPPAAPAPTAPPVSNAGMGGGLADVIRRGFSDQKRVLGEMQAEAKTAAGIPIPTLDKLPEAPKVKTTDFMEMFGSAAMGLAALGPLLTRRSLTNSLNAGKAVMDAFHKNDMEAAQNAFNQWQIETKNAVTLHNFAQDAYHNAIEKSKNSREALNAELTGVAAMLKDEVVLAYLNRGDTATAVQMITGHRPGLSASMQEAQLRLNDEMEKRGDIRRAQAITDPEARAHAIQEVQAKWQLREHVGDLPKTVTAGTQSEADTAQIARADFIAANGRPPGPDDESELARLREDHRAAVAAGKAGLTEGGKLDARLAKDPRYILNQKIVDLTKERELAEKAGDTEELNRIDGEIRAAKGARESAAQAKEKDAETLAKANWQKDHPGQPLPEYNSPELAEYRTRARTQQGVTLSDDDAKFVAQRYIAGDRSALVGWGRTPGGLAKITHYITELSKEQNLDENQINARIAEFQGVLAADRTLGTRAVHMEIPAAELSKFAPLAAGQSEKLNRTNYPTLNSVIVAAQKGTGDVNVVQFAQTVNSIINLYARFLNPQGEATDAMRSKAEEILSTAWSSGQFKGAMQNLQREIDFGRQSLLAVQKEIRDGYLTQGASESGSAGPFANGRIAGATFNAPEDVAAAFKAGKLNREEAAQILREKFGAK